jgi:hypothetical protein
MRGIMEAASKHDEREVNEARWSFTYFVMAIGASTINLRSSKPTQCRDVCRCLSATTPEPTEEQGWPSRTFVEPRC